MCLIIIHIDTLCYIFEETLSERVIVITAVSTVQDADSLLVSDGKQISNHGEEESTADVSILALF